MSAFFAQFQFFDLILKRDISLYANFMFPSPDKGKKFLREEIFAKFIFAIEVPAFGLLRGIYFRDFHITIAIRGNKTKQN